MANFTRPDAQHGAPSSAVAPSVRIATLLMYALIAVNVVRGLLSIVAKDALLDAFADSRGYDRNTEYGKLAIEGAPEYTTIAIGSLVIFGGLLLVTAIFLQRGARWARIVATIVAVLSALNLLVAFAQPAPLWYKLLGILAGLLAVGILVMLYRKDSNEFFRRAA